MFDANIQIFPSIGFLDSGIFHTMPVVCAIRSLCQSIRQRSGVAFISRVTRKRQWRCYELLFIEKAAEFTEFLQISKKQHFADQEQEILLKVFNDLTFWICCFNRKLADWIKTCWTYSFLFHVFLYAKFTYFSSPLIQS